MIENQIEKNVSRDYFFFQNIASSWTMNNTSEIVNATDIDIE